MDDRDWETLHKSVCVAALVLEMQGDKLDDEEDSQGTI